MCVHERSTNHNRNKLPHVGIVVKIVIDSANGEARQQSEKKKKEDPCRCVHRPDGEDREFWFDILYDGNTPGLHRYYFLTGPYNVND